MRNRLVGQDGCRFHAHDLFDPDGFWEHDAELDRGSATRRGLNVLQLIQKVFRYGRKDTASTLGKVRFTTDLAEIDAVLRARQSHSTIWRLR